MYCWFPDDFKPKHVSYFAIHLKKSQESEGKKKTWFRESIFPFEIFETLESFWKSSDRKYVFIVQTSFAGLIFLFWLLVQKLFAKLFAVVLHPA